MSDPAMMRVFEWCLFLTLMCVLSEHLRWRRLRRLNERVDALSARADVQLQRGDSLSGRITLQVGRVDEQAVGLAEVLERTRLHRRMLDLQHARLDIHGRAIGVHTVFEDLDSAPRTEPDPGCEHNLVNGGTFFVCTKCNGDFDDLGNAVLPTLLRSGLAT